MQKDVMSHSVTFQQKKKTRSLDAFTISNRIPTNGTGRKTMNRIWKQMSRGLRLPPKALMSWMHMMSERKVLYADAIHAVYSCATLSHGRPSTSHDAQQLARMPHMHPVRTTINQSRRALISNLNNLIDPRPARVAQHAIHTWNGVRNAINRIFSSVSFILEIFS